VLKVCLSQSFDILEKQYRSIFFPDEDVQLLDQAITEVSDEQALKILADGPTLKSKEMPLASTLPGITKLVTAAINSEPNLYVDVCISRPLSKI
jgi:spore germination protein GerM